MALEGTLHDFALPDILQLISLQKKTGLKVKSFYAPDYAVNAGGLMNVSLEIDGYNRERAMRMMRTIYHNLGKIFAISKRDNIPSYKAADRMAEERIQTIGKIRLPHMGNGAPRFLGRMRGLG